MSANRTATTLSALSLVLIGLCFILLLYEVVITRQLWAEIPRLFAAFLAPVPLAIFIAYCFAYRAGAAQPEYSPVRMMIYLILSTGLTIGIGMAIGREPAGGGIGSGPAITESAVFSASILNFLFLRSPLLAAGLSGISIGLTIFVIFLT